MATVSALVGAGCFHESGSDSADSVDPIDTVVGGEGTDSIVPDAPSSDTTPDTEVGAGAATIDSVVGPAADYVSNSLEALKPESSVNPASYCQNAASTMRDPQSQATAPSDGTAPQEVLDAVKTWTEQTELLAAAFDACAKAPDAAAYLASPDFGKAWGRFQACFKKLFPDS